MQVKWRRKCSGTPCRCQVKVYMQTEKANSVGVRFIAPSAHVLAPYPVDMSEFLAFSHKVDQPTRIAQDALVQWKHYLASGDAAYARAFLARAQWLVEHEVRIAELAGGWPISLPHTALSAEGAQRLCLSALTQGIGLSVLIRAYQLT